jgi:NADH dehydrogenase
MRGGADTVDTVDRQGNRNLIAAAQSAGVQQFIFISFLGASLDNPMPLFQAKAETEAALVDSGLAYTILAPNYYFETWVGMVVGIPLQAQQPITLVGEGKRLHSLISVMDVAAYTVAAIGHPAAMDQRLALGGPEPLTWAGIAAAFEEVLGAPLPLQFITPGDPIPMLPEMVPPVLAAMETYDSVIPMEGMARTFGVIGTPLTSFIYKMLGIQG